MDNFFNKFDKKTINYITQYIDNNECNKRKTKYSTHFYVSNIYYVLKTGVQWNALDVKCHYTTIYKKFVMWNKLKIFDLIYDELIEKYKNSCIIKNVYIDASHIRNVNGTDLIGRNHYDRFRNSTKLHLLIDDNRVPIAFTFTKGNINDGKLTSKLSEPLKQIIKMDNRRTINLIGDKGYTNFKLRDELKKDNINLLTPLKKNNKIITNKKSYNRVYNKFNRISIENVFCRIDKFKRLYSRYEKKVINFKGFHLIAFINIILRNLNN